METDASKDITEMETEASKYRGSKVFNDPIHGSIVIPEACVKIIDTPEFQRLRSIKQLGAVSFVYPGAVHTRFEHCIGVCYLAGQLAKTLKENHPLLKITDRDVLCVEIAGLCHDLGHGPFSHTFESTVIPRMFEGESKYSHEDYSEKLFDYLLKKNELEKWFDDRELTIDYRNSIKDLFKGKRQEGGVFNGKEFLYEIVANERSGIDVDKWDYFARDCHMLGFSNNFDYKRCIQMARVLDIDGQKQICFRDKEANNLYDMFHTRLTLHRKAYQHKVARNVDAMISDAMVKALKTDAIKFKGKTRALTLKEAIEEEDLLAYCQMTDNIISQIRQSTSTDISVLEAQELLKRIDIRDLYVLVEERHYKGDAIKGKKEMNIAAIVDIVDTIEKEAGVTKGTVIIDNIYLDYGNKKENPVEHLWFYDKNFEKKRLEKGEVSHLLPEVFQEQLIRVYCTDKKFEEAVSAAFKNWSPEQTEVKGSKTETVLTESA